MALRDLITLGLGPSAETVPDYPAEGDVEAGVLFGSGAYTGTFAVPAEEDVESGVQYGAGGTEFTGTLLVAGGASDWTADEKKQIRQALGVTGLTAATSGTGNLDAVLEDTSTTLPALMAACASVAANSSDATASGAITRKRGNSWSIALTLGEVTGYTSLWFTIKSSYDNPDTAALVQVKLNSPSAADGLLYVNGATATNAALASITVSNAGTGAIVVAIDETVTDDLAPGTYYYDAQMLNTGAVTTPDSGTFTITADVTRSVA